MVKESIAQVLDTKPGYKEYNGTWLSVSKVKTFKSCPAKFRYSYIEKLPRKTWDFHIFGSFLHEVLEFFHQAKLDGDLRPNNELMTICFKSSLNNFKDLNNSQKKEAWGILNTYLQQLKAAEEQDQDSSQILNVEESFYIDIDGVVLLNGFIDLVKKDSDNILHVADYKTSKHKKYLKKDLLQLKTYAYVKCVEDPSIERIRASYIMLRHDFDAIQEEFTREEVMTMESEFLNYAEEIKAEKLWRPNPNNLCKYCDFLEKCDAGKEHVREKDDLQFGAVTW